MYDGALLYATKNHIPNCMKMTGKMGGNKFAKPNSVLTLQLSFDAEMTGMVLLEFKANFSEQYLSKFLIDLKKIRVVSNRNSILSNLRGSTAF